MKKRLLIIGASGHGKVALDATLKQDEYEVVGWLDSNLVTGSNVLGYEILGKTQEVKEIAIKYNIDSYFIAISNNYVRKKVFEYLNKECPNLSFATIIHPGSIIGLGSTIEAGSLILSGSIVGVSSIIKIGSILNSKATLEHDGIMNSWSSILPGVCTGGNIVLGSLSYICIGSIISHNIKIGDNSVVGAGSVVLKDQPSDSVIMGTPAIAKRFRSEEENPF